MLLNNSLATATLSVCQGQDWGGSGGKEQWAKGEVLRNQSLSFLFLH